MRHILTILIVLALFTLAFAANIFSEVTAVPSTNRVTLSWVTKSETGIQQFAILRSNDDVHYIKLAGIDPKGPGTHYEYVDLNVMFKDVSPLFYKIRALNSQGEKIDESSLIVHPNISGIFRTWGAIKAMFR